MKTKPALKIDFSAGPRPENETQFGTSLGGSLIARILRPVAVHIKKENVLAKTGDGTKMRRPLDFVLDIESNAVLENSVLTRDSGNDGAIFNIDFVDALASFGLVQTVVNIVVAEL